MTTSEDSKAKHQQKTRDEGQSQKKPQTALEALFICKKMRAKRVQAVSNKVNHDKSFNNTIERTFEDAKHAINKTCEGQRCIFNIYW